MESLMQLLSLNDGNNNTEGETQADKTAKTVEAAQTVEAAPTDETAETGEAVPSHSKKYKKTSTNTTSNMAIKNIAIESENANQLNLVLLGQYLQALMTSGPVVLIPPAQLLNDIREIVKALASSEMLPDTQAWPTLHIIEDFLLQVTSSLNADMRKTVIGAAMSKLFEIISKTDTDPCAYTSLILILFDVHTMEMIETARAVVEESCKEKDSTYLGNCLSNLFRWCYEWQGCVILGQFVKCFIKAFEDNQLYDLLVSVSKFHIEGLFLTLNSPNTLRQSMSDVVFYVLASCRYATEVIDKIAPHVGQALATLAADSSQWSRQLLQHLVDILSAMVDNLLEDDQPVEEEISSTTDDLPDDKIPNRVKYFSLIGHLERHMASCDCMYLQNTAWKKSKRPENEIQPPRPQRKAGLTNLGNTCYMNSVIQALLATKQFSNSVILYKDSAPYWSRLCDLFTKMHHSLSCKLNPIELFQVIKPPYFITNSQHDSSEFLVYMFETLQCYEFHSELGFDYLNPPPRVLPSIALHANKDMDDDYSSAGASASTEHRSGSPMPCSSSGITGQKRFFADDLEFPLKKRARREPKDKPGKSKNKAKPKQYDSLLDQLFGGIMLTRLQCSDCGAASSSRDVFRDLQLAFPEKLENKQLSVQYLIEYYFSDERLCGDNRYQCPDCKQLKDAERSVLIELPPKYLIIVLKNFRYEQKMQVHAKLMHDMHYDMTISLPTQNPHGGRPHYDLYAGIVHSGTTLDSGHYFTLAHDGEQWHEYNDEVVTLTSEDEINSLKNSCTPYILFYRRSDVLEPAPPTFEELCPSLRQMLESHRKHVVEVVQRMKTIQSTRP